MRKVLASVLLLVVPAYLACGALLWLLQGRLIFEPVRRLAVQASDLPFPAKDVAIPVGGQTLHAWWMPAQRTSPKVVLYFHGNDGNVSTSIAETALLRELGPSLLVVDYRGYGTSDGAFPSEDTMYEDAEAALGFVVHRLGEKPRDVYLYGQSLGAAVAIELAVRHPEVGGLVVENGFTSIYEMARLNPLYAIYPVGLVLNQRFDSIDKVSRLRMPVLYIHGTRDRIVPFAMGDALFEHSGGKKRFIAVPGGEHMDNARVAPRLLKQAISELMGLEPDLH